MNRVSSIQSLLWLMRWDALVFWRTRGRGLLIPVAAVLIIPFLSSQGGSGTPRPLDEKALLHALWRGNALLVGYYLWIPLLFIALLAPLGSWWHLMQVRKPAVTPSSATGQIFSSPIPPTTLFAYTLFKFAAMAWLVAGINFVPLSIAAAVHGSPQLLFGTIALAGMSLVTASSGAMLFALLVRFVKHWHWWAVGISWMLVVLMVWLFTSVSNGYFGYVHTGANAQIWNVSSPIWFFGRALIGNPVSIVVIVFMGLTVFLLTVRYGSNAFFYATRTYNEYRLPWFLRRSKNPKPERPVIFRRTFTQAIAIKEYRGGYALLGATVGVVVSLLVLAAWSDLAALD